MMHGSGAPTRDLSRRLRRSCDVVGSGVLVDGHLSVSNLGYLEIGNRVRIRATAARSHLSVGPAGRLTIGDDVSIGHGAAIAAHLNVVIGAGAAIEPFVMIMDTDFHEAGRHDAAGGRSPIYIGAGARLGARVIVLRGSTIGEGAIVSAGSVVKGVVPACAHVRGVPARASSEHADAPAAVIDAAAVGQVVARTLGLRQAPRPDVSRHEIAEWDSLGSLNLLLALEQEFAIAIRPESLFEAATIEELVAALRLATPLAS